MNKCQKYLTLVHTIVKCVEGRELIDGAENLTGGDRQTPTLLPLPGRIEGQRSTAGFFAGTE